MSILVTSVVHKAVIKVDEKGTKAAGVTMARGWGSGYREPEEIIKFKADHPFLFLIKDKTTGLVLFIGKVETFNTNDN